MFKHCPRTLIELRFRAIEEVIAISRQIFNGTIQIFGKRLQQNINSNGRHIEDIIFQTLRTLNVTNSSIIQI